MVKGKGFNANKKTVISVLFLEHLYGPVGFEAYKKYHPNVKVLNNQEILDRIKNECKDVEFVIEESILNLKKRSEDFDGLLVFGAPQDEMISTGLPIVAVEQPLFECSTVECSHVIPFNIYKGKKVIASYLPVYCDKNPEIYSLRIKDIAKKISLISAISKMKSLKILVVTDLPPLGYFEPAGEQFEKGRKEYEEVYISNLKEVFGEEFITVPQEELFEKFKKADEKEAKEIAQKWILGAVALRGTNEIEVISSAKLYLGMKELMEEYNCGAITTEGFGWPSGSYKNRVEKYEKSIARGIPAQGMPTSQFCTDGVVAVSETLTDCLITQQLGFYITGSTGLLGDYNIDPFINIAIICHCEGTLKPYKYQEILPYFIRNLPFVKENTGGACAQAHYPIGKTVTVAKISMYKKRLSIFTGETVSGEDLFPYWDDILGRNKVAVKADAKKLLENVDWKTFGWHRTVFFGDYRQEFKDLAKLIGFEVVEEDK